MKELKMAPMLQPQDCSCSTRHVIPESKPLEEGVC